MKDNRYYIDVDKLLSALDSYKEIGMSYGQVFDEINKLSKVSMSLSTSSDGSPMITLSNVCKEVSVADLLLYNENPHIAVCVVDQYDRPMAVDELWHMIRFRKDIWDYKVLSYVFDTSENTGERILRIKAKEPVHNG